MEGWIKVHRQLLSDHWLNDDPAKGWAWLKVLANVNHENKKVLIGNKLMICGRGESLRSLDGWAELFGRGWDKSKVRRFFALLKNDGMINLKSEIKTTRLTVLNYDTYQGAKNTNETQVKHKRHRSDTETTPNKNEKNEKNEKKNILDGRSLSFRKAFQDFREFRKNIKKPLTIRAEELLLSKLEKLEQDDSRQILILEQSIIQGWQGVFPLRDYGSGAKPKNTETSQQYSGFERWD